MNEEETVKLFLKNGFQVSKNALPLILENPEQILSELKKMKPRPFIISEQHLRNIQKPVVKITPAEVKLIKEYKQGQKPVSVKDYVDHLVSRYDELKKIISKKMTDEKLTSINKIATQTMMFSIIGIVREKGNNNILIEDPTGEVYVFFDNLKEKLDEITLDDVIGVTIKKVKDKFYAKNVVFPDVSSNREINKTEKNMVLAVVSNPSSLDDSKCNNLISVLSSTEDLCSMIFLDDNNSEKLTCNFSKFNPITNNTNPSLFQIENMQILLLPKKFFETLTFDSKTSDTITSMLKKRHLASSFILNTHTSHDEFVLTEVPDIIISNSGETINKNYKGTTIISNSNPAKIFLINLRTREVTEKTL